MTDDKKSSGSDQSDRSKEILVDFLDEEILQAQDSLRRSRTFGIVLTAIVALYMGYLVHGLGEFLQPERAAELTTIFVAEQVQDNSDKLADEIKTAIPGMVAKLPDHFLEEMPKYRQKLEDTVISNSEQHMRATISALDLNLANFLREHEVDVKTLLSSSETLDVPEAFNEAFYEWLMEYLTSVPPTGESFSQRLQRSLDILKIAEERIDFLALNKNLSRTEKKTRYALAVLSHSIGDQLHLLQMQARAE